MKKNLGNIIYIGLGLLYAYILGLIIFLVGSLSVVPYFLRFLLWLTFIILQVVDLIKNLRKSTINKLFRQFLYFILIIIIFYYLDPAP